MLLSWMSAEQESFAQKTHLVNGQPSQVCAGLGHLTPLHAVGASPVHHGHDTTTFPQFVIACNSMLLMC